MSGWRPFRSTDVFFPAASPQDLTGWRKGFDRLLRVLGPTWRATPVRRSAQAACLALFLYLFFYVSWPYAEIFSGQVLSWKEWVPVESFLWLDPLAGLSAALAARAWNVALFGAGAVLLTSLLFPRGFCGYVCPLGTLLDVFDWVIGKRVRTFRSVAGERWAGVRFCALAVVLAAALCGVLLSGFVAAIPVLTRGLLFTGARLQLGLLKNWAMLSPAGVETYLSVGLFAAIFLLGLLGGRFWCRHLCPSGALLSLFGWARLYEKEVSRACNRCGKCADACPFGAVAADLTARRLDCASCQTCAGVCPAHAIRFGPRGSGQEVVSQERASGGIVSRRAFLASGLGGAAVALAARPAPGERPRLLRPPGSVIEEQFLGLCVRCGQCLQVCPGPVLRAAGVEAGLEALWTPVADPSHAGCHPDCNFCTQVCPTGAILPLTAAEKRATRMGMAVIDSALCLPHRGERDCQLCLDECNAAGYQAIEMRFIPLAVGDVPEGAFSLSEIEEMGRIAAPFVNARACVGCGLCQYRCQAANARQRRLLPRSAIVITADNADRRFRR